jgi:predicted phage terminase large subunit-like protein
MGALDLSKFSDVELEILEANLEKRTSYERFCEDQELFPGEAPAKAHRLICTVVQMALDGEAPNVMIFAPPGTAKTTYVSKRAVAFAVGYRPKIKTICLSHTKTLAAKFGRESRNIVAHPAYQTIFPEVRLAEDLKARDDWATMDGSEVFCVGMDGALPGRRADLLIIDDPFTGRLQADSQGERDNRWATYNGDARKRLRKNGALILMHTRWHDDDIAGRILPEEWDGESGWIECRDGRTWLVLNLQMINEFPGDLLGRPIGKLRPQNDEERAATEASLLWKDFFSLERVMQDLKDSEREFMAQCQGRPKDKAGGILPAGRWRKWPGKRPPVVEYIVQSYDTAFEEEEANDFSARTTWAVFDIYNDANSEILAEIWKQTGNKEVHRHHVIMIEGDQWKVQFPELKRMAIDAYKQYKPDRVLIEKKASGHSLIQELRRGKVPVKPMNPNKMGGSKTTRAHVASEAFKQGTVWYMDRDWARIVINQCAKFPTGKNDDLVDTVTQSIIWFRRTYHLEFKGEDDDDED